MQILSNTRRIILFQASQALNREAFQQRLGLRKNSAPCRATPSTLGRFICANRIGWAQILEVVDALRHWTKSARCCSRMSQRRTCFGSPTARQTAALAPPFPRQAGKGALGQCRPTRQRRGIPQSGRLRPSSTGIRSMAASRPPFELNCPDLPEACRHIIFR